MVHDEATFLFKTRFKEVMKYFGLILLFVLGSLFFNYRYLVPEAGISSRSLDYSTHIAIEEHIKEGLLFPEWGKAEKGLHAVSKYLPVYHGLLGFHLSAIALEAFGVPLPGAYVFITDFSLAVYLLFFSLLLYQEIQREKRWEFLAAILTIGTIFISNFSRAANEAFFSQIFAYAILIVAWYAWTLKKKIFTALLVLFAVVTYPDFLVWVLPVLVFDRSRYLHIGVRGFFSIVWCTLVYTLYTRRSLPGPEAVSLYPLIFLSLISALFWKSLYRQHRTFFLCLTSYSVVTIGFLFVSQVNFNWGYYAIKLVYPASFFLIYAFLKVPLLRVRGGRLFIFMYLFFFWNFSDISWSAVGQYVNRNKVVNNRSYASIIETKKIIEELKICRPQHTIILPSQDDVPEDKEGILGLWVKNSVLLNSEISSGLFVDPTFLKIYGSFLNFGRSFSENMVEGNEQVFAALKKDSFQHDICIVLPAAQRSLFNGNPCFVIMREQGGQIYARCQAKAEL